MIQANELRIGNYLLRNGIVVAIDARSIFDIWDKSEEYSGIKISDEWLEKLGFEQYSDDGYETDWHGNGIILVEGVGYILEDRTGVRLQYIHQLQNLYYALTGKELTL